MGSVLHLGSLIVLLKGDAKHFNSVMKGALNTIKSITSTMMRYARRAAIVGAAIGIMSAKAFASFEEQLANVSTMLEEQTMKYLPAYARGMKQLAIQFGEGTDTLSKGLYDILSASIDPAQAMNVLSVSVKAAKAGMTDTGIAADAITTILNAYSLSADKAADVSDLLFGIVKRGKTTFAELAPSIGMVVSIAATAGVSLEDVAASLATMTRAGVRTQTAVMALKNVINSFISPQEESVKAARDYGLELNSQTLKIKGLIEALKQLQGISVEDLNKIFPNIRAMTGVAPVIQQMTGALYDYDFMLNRAGLTQQAYEKMTGTLSHAMHQLWQAIKITSVGIGERLAPSIKELAEYLADNQTKIEYWATYFADRVVFVFDVLKEFVMWMKTDWKSAAIGMWEIFVGAMKTAGRVIISLAVRIGEGLMQGIKLGMSQIAPTFEDILREYQLMGGSTNTQGGMNINYPMATKGPIEPLSTQMRTISVDKQLWEEATKNIKLAERQKYTNELFQGFGEEVKKEIENNLRNTSFGDADIYDTILQKYDELKQKDLERKQILKDTEETQKEAVHWQEEYLKKLGQWIDKKFGPEKTTKEWTKEQEKELKLVQSLMNSYKEEYEWIQKTNDARFKSVQLAEELIKQMYPDDLVAQGQAIEAYKEQIDSLIEFSKGLREFIKNPQELYQDYADKVEQALKQGFITAEEAAKALTKKGSEMQGQNEGRAREISSYMSAAALASGDSSNEMVRQQIRTNEILERLEREQRQNERQVT